MKTSPPLFLQEDDLLLPDHLQLQERIAQSLLIPLLRYRFPEFWGVGGAVIDEKALDRGTLALASGSFLFRDGTYCVVNENAWCEERPFDDALKGGGVATVYLGLKREGSCGAEVAVGDDPCVAAASGARYFGGTVGKEVPDLHVGGAFAPVRFRRLLLRLFWMTELARCGEYHLIPLMQLARSGAKVETVTDFVPPLLSLKSSSRLFEMILELRDLLAARCRGIESGCGAKAATREVGGRDVSLFLLHQVLRRYHVILSELTEAAQVHPLPVYLSLLQLVGELSAVAPTPPGRAADPSSPELRRYDHRNLSGCFRWVREQIYTVLESLDEGPDHLVTLRREGTCFSADLKAVLLQENTRYYLALHSSYDLSAQRLESALRVAPPSHLPLVASNSFSGVALTRLAVLPRGLPRSSRAVYLLLDHFTELWTLVVKERNLAVHWPEAPQDLRMELVALGRSDS